MIRFDQIFKLPVRIFAMHHNYLQNKTSMNPHQFLADSDHQDLCPTFIRGVSHDDFLFALCNKKSQTHENNLFIETSRPQIYVPEKQTSTMDNTFHSGADDFSGFQPSSSDVGSGIVYKQPIKIENQYQKIENKKLPQFSKYTCKKVKANVFLGKDKKDYKKNICGYITKKIVREFLSPVYKEKIQRLCSKYGCDYELCVSFYDKKIERITGPTHLDMLLNTSKQNLPIKKCFKQFFIWFLRHRYLRYLIIEGKMQRKDTYIDYKNRTLLYLGSMEQNASCMHKQISCTQQQDP